MKFFHIAVCCLAFGALGVSAQQINRIEITPERPLPLYQCGETASFSIILRDAAGKPVAGEVEVRLKRDGAAVLRDSRENIDADRPLTVTTTLAEPGFVQLEVKAGSKKALHSAGFSPEKIVAATAMPADFDAYWQAALAEAAAVPADLHLEPMPEFTNAAMRAFRFDFAHTKGTRMYGFLSLPPGNGPFPAVVIVHPSGPGHSKPDTDWVREGVAVLLLNAHAYAPLTDGAALNALYARTYGSEHFSAHGAPDREAWFFRRAIPGVWRGVELLATLPEIDADRIVAYGSSMGGFFALTLAGLSERIQAAGALVPAMGDHHGADLGRLPGWPKLAGRSAAHKAMLAYFDLAFFVRGITAPVKISVGLVDDTCVPSSVYAAYNAIPGTVNKEILPDPAIGHGASSASINRVRRFLLEAAKAETPARREKK